MSGGAQPAAALRLLKGVAGELRDLAVDTARFGEKLSDERRNCPQTTTVELLQHIDLFVQRLTAHALLIDDLSTRLDGEAADAGALNELIEQVPFFGIRQRLKAVLGGAGERAAVVDEAADEHWF